MRIESVKSFLKNACHDVSYRKLQDIYLENLPQVTQSGKAPKFAVGVICVPCLNWLRRNIGGSFCERRKERTGRPDHRVIAKRKSIPKTAGLFRQPRPHRSACRDLCPDVLPVIPALNGSCTAEQRRRSAAEAGGEPYADAA